MRRLGLRAALVALVVASCARGPSSGVREACATAQDAHDAMVRFVGAGAELKEAQAEEKTASNRRETAAEQDALMVIDEGDPDVAADLPAANEAHRRAQDRLTAARAEARERLDPFEDALAALGQAANRSGDDRLARAATKAASPIEAGDGGLRDVATECNRLGVPLRVDPSVSSAF